MTEKAEFIQAKDSFTGYLTTHLSDWANRSNNIFALGLKKSCAEVGYALLTLIGIVETVVKPILGVIFSLFSLLFLSKIFFNKTAAPLFAGMFFSSLSTALAASKLYTNVFGEKAKPEDIEDRCFLDRFIHNSHTEGTSFFVSLFWIPYSLEPIEPIVIKTEPNLPAMGG